jgi:ABC-type Na+ efflux pump permease subunit
MRAGGKWAISALLSLLLIGAPSLCVATQSHCGWYPEKLDQVLMPGSVIALMLSGPRHIVLPAVVIGASFLVYVILLYLILDLWRRVHGE